MVIIAPDDRRPAPDESEDEEEGQQPPDCLRHARGLAPRELEAGAPWMVFSGEFQVRRAGSS